MVQLGIPFDNDNDHGRWSSCCRGGGNANHRRATDHQGFLIVFAVHGEYYTKFLKFYSVHVIISLWDA